MKRDSQMTAQKDPFILFDEIISLADRKLFDFTKNESLLIEKKADKTLVTAADKLIDATLKARFEAEGFAVISEEGSQEEEIAKTGNYVTIDPIDGTLGYVEYANYALQNQESSKGDVLFSKDLGPASDFCLLLGIVENGAPRYGAVFNFVTKEKILIDALNPYKIVREKSARNYTQRFAAYVDQRPGEALERKLLAMPGVEAIKQATVGLKSTYAMLNHHEAAVMVHRVQLAGLWDILPGAVAARAFGGKIFDDLGDPLKLDEYVVIPGKGVTAIKGKKFAFVEEELKKLPNELNK